MMAATNQQNGHDDGGDAVDPLDAFMETLHVPATTATTADARRDQQQQRQQQQQAQAPRAAAAAAIAPTTTPTARNRRYRRLQQLLASGDGRMGAEAEDAYFSDAMMQERSPALFHLHLGQYLNVASRDDRAPPTSDMVTLSSFLIAACDRRDMEARRVTEQRSWGRYRSVDDSIDDDHDDIVEEEEEESEDEEDESKCDDHDVTIDERRRGLIELMSQRFLQGCDVDYVDYAAIDSDASLDDLTTMDRDAEDRYFANVGEENGGDHMCEE